MKKRFTRILCTLLALVFCVASLTGCGNQPAAEPTPSDQPQAETAAPDTAAPVAKEAYSKENADVVIRMYQYDGEFDLTKNSYVAYHQVFKDYVESHTDGRIYVEIYPDSSLGNVDSMPEQCRNGIVDIISGQNASIYTTYVPEFCVFEVPFSFSSEEIMREFLRDESLNELKDKLVEVAGLRLLSILPASFRWPITAKAPITCVADMKGLNIRTSTGLLMEKTYELLGCNVYTTAFSEVLTSVQTGILDAWEGSIQTAFTSGYYEVTKYINMYPVLGNIPTVAINEEFFQNLSEADQKILVDAAHQAEASFAGCLIGVNTTITKASMIGNGAVIYQPTAEQIEEMRAATQEQALKTAIENYGVSEAYLNEFLAKVAAIEKWTNDRAY